MKYTALLILNFLLMSSAIAQLTTNIVNIPIDIIKSDNSIESITYPVEVVRDGQAFEEINVDVSSIKVNSKKLRIKVNNLFYHTFTNSSVVVNPPSTNTSDTNTVVNPPTTNTGDTNVVVNPPITNPPTVTPPPTVVDNTIKTNNVIIDIELKLSTGQITTLTNFAAEVVENIQSGEITEILVDTTLLPQNAQILKIKLRDLLFDYARKNEDDNLVDPIDRNDGGADNNISPPTDGVDNQSLNGPSFVQLPIEVLGEDQHTEEIKLVLNDNVSDVHGIKLQVHNLSFTNKMAISVNNSPWVNLNNTNVFFTKQFDKAMYGMGGGHNTLTFIVSFATNNIIPAITNTIKFKFNDRNKETVGYRVLDVDLVKAQPNGYELNFLHIASWDPVRPVNWGVNTNWINKYTSLKLLTVKTQNDPSKWVPISTDVSVINRGKDLWFNGNISERGIAINAKCTDCHTSDGYDLKYFNYSDKSIIARSKYHGLSDEDSSAIASYIRTLNVPYQEKGRPWNPPYQPGPGLDSKPLNSWAAGAGIEAVADYDLQTYKALFPNGMDAGIKYDDGVGPINFNKSLNMREIPLVIQMPDWKDWLPRNHLKDVAPDIWNYISKTNQYRLPTYFANAINNYKPNDSLWNLKNLYWGHGEAIAYSWIQMYQTTKLLDNYRESADEWKNIKIRNVIGPAWNHYVAVKHWEIMNKLGLQELGHDIYNPNNKDAGNNPMWKSYGSGIDPVEYQNKTGVPITQGVQKRRWYDTLTFHLAPHIMGNATVTDMSSPLWNQTTWGPKSFMWYQVQMLLDDTNKNPNRNVIDWAYLFALSNTTQTHGTTDFDIFKIKSWAIHFLNGLKTDEAYALTAGVPNDKLSLEGRYYPPRSQSDLLGLNIQANDHRFSSDSWWGFLTFSLSFAAASQNPEQRQAIMIASSKLIDAEINFMNYFDAAYLINQGLTKNQPDAWEAGIKYTGGDVNLLNKVKNFRSRIWPDYVSTYSDKINHVYPAPWPNLK